MAWYYDSSFVLSAVLEQRGDLDYAALWDVETIRLSAHLLRIECVVVIRRVGQRTDKLDELLEFINFKYLDDAFERIVRTDIRLSRCRSLDAIHLAIAEHFKSSLSEAPYICSLDERMRKAATEMEYSVLPD